MSSINWIGLKTFIFIEVGRFLRVSVQTIVTPWISALLYIFIFGFVIGKNINLVSGVTYIDFVLPGILMMSVIMASFAQTSSSLYFQRFARHIEEILVAPLSYIEMILGYVFGGILRGVTVGVGIFIIAVFFSAANIEHFWIFIFYAVFVSIIFSLLGIVIGLWADSFEQLSVLNTFVIMPLSFLGGVFNSITMFPEKIQFFVKLNPIFYFIDGIRYSMIGISESNLLFGVLLIVSLCVVLFIFVVYLFKSGYRLRT